jgi:hypothetical protein
MYVIVFIGYLYQNNQPINFLHNSFIQYYYSHGYLIDKSYALLKNKLNKNIMKNIFLPIILNKNIIIILNLRNFFII